MTSRWVISASVEIAFCLSSQIMEEVMEHNGPDVQPHDTLRAFEGRAATGISRNNLRLDLTDTLSGQMSDLEAGGSEQDDVNMNEDDVNAIMGITIGKEQTRLMSPRTPAAEKIAAMEGQADWGFLDGVDDDEDEDTEIDSPKKDEHSPGAHGQLESCSVEKLSPTLDPPSTPTVRPLPSSWTATPKIFETPKKNDLDQPTSSQRNRASTGATGLLAEMNIKRFLSSISMPTISEPKFLKDLSFPRLPAFFSPPKDPGDEDSSGNRTRRSNTVVTPKSVWTDSSSEARQSGPPLSESTSTIVNSEAGIGHGSPLTDHTSHEDRLYAGADNENLSELEQVPTHHSFSNASALSAVTSYGDDSRFKNRKKMTNVRRKAIMDTFQGTNIFPSMPSVNLEALIPSFGHRRAGGQSKTRNRGNSVSGEANDQDSSSKTKLFMKKPDYKDLDKALDDLTGDLVIMGGYRGSILRTAAPPHHQLWGAFKVGLNLRNVNLEVGLDPEDELNMENKVFSSGMVTHVGPIDFGERLFEKLRSSKNAQDGKLRVHDYGYDWRLSPHLLSRKLIQYLETMYCNQPEVPKEQRGVTLIAHSFGGLIARHAVNQRPDLFAGVVYAGVPQHCVNILGPLRHGDDVLFNSDVLSAQANFTMRTTFALLPESGNCFLDKDTREEYLVDFFNPESWKEYCLSPCIAPAIEEKKGPLASLAGLASKANSIAHPEHNLANDIQMGEQPSSSNATKVTIPLPEAQAYLERTLDETLCFKKETYFKPELEEANLYPAISILYSIDTPSPSGCLVAGREGIRLKDAYKKLVFGSGDGVVLARAAMAPEGYRVVRGGKVKTNRGHVALLGDLEAVGRCLIALQKGRKNEIGQGRERVAGLKIYDGEGRRRD